MIIWLNGAFGVGKAGDRRGDGRPPARALPRPSERARPVDTGHRTPAEVAAAVLATARAA